MNSFYFALVMFLFFMQIGRKIGWSLSRNVLYRNDLSFYNTLIVILGWTLLVFGLDLAIIKVFQPHWVIKWIFGYALGMYVASPNFGLINEATITDEMSLERHNMIKDFPQILFLALVVIYEVIINFL